MKGLIGTVLAVSLSGSVLANESPETVFPQQLSAKTLVTYCASSSLTDRGRQRQRYCAGFVSGVEESLRLLSVRTKQDHELSLCVPASASARQFQDALIRYAGRPGTDLDQPAVLVAVEALKAAFTCGVD